MTLDTALISINLVLVAVLLAVLIWRRFYRALPLFVAYVAYTLLLALVSLAFSSRALDYLVVWGVGITIDTLFYLCVLVEVGGSVLRYNRASPLPWGLVLLLFLAASVPVGLLAQWPAVTRFQFVYQLNFRVMQATAVLEIAALLTLAWWSGLKKLHWPECELRLVMGMSSWALVQICVLLLHEHGLIGPGYHWLDLLTPASTLGVSIYWLHYFWLDRGFLTEAGMGSPMDRIADTAGSGDNHRCNGISFAEQE